MIVDSVVSIDTWFGLMNEDSIVVDIYIYYYLMINTTRQNFTFLEKSEKYIDEYSD